MNFSTSEFMLGRQRPRPWIPLITQQFRLRHLYQIRGFNLVSEMSGSYYFTLHLTTMSAPFYTSEQMKNPNPKWAELDLRNIANTSASCIVLRIWQHNSDGIDKIILTWGVNFSGLVYLGNKIVEIQPVYFKSNSVIFFMQGGYYTSHQVIKTDLQKPIPFLSNLNLINTLNDKVIYRRVAAKVLHSEIQNSYNINKFRRLHNLQIEIKKKNIEVENIRNKINIVNGSNFNVERDNLPHNYNPSSTTSKVRYAPQLLTMNSLNRMLQEKPTRVQKQEMVKINKEIEIAKFKMRLLSQEKDKKTVIIRQLRHRLASTVEENEERNSDLMENYHKLRREGEKLKEYKRSLLQHREVYSVLNSQLQMRRRRLMQELLFIYPIEKISDSKYTVHEVYLPNSDILADCSDTGLSIALGYITHILIMCSTFLQVPLRYPLTHYGSRSYITDNVSPLLSDKERDFPLYTRGKDKAQFTYAVYLLNKNLAQLRWLYYMNTSDLRATLANLLNFLQGKREYRMDTSSHINNKVAPREEKQEDIKQEFPSSSSIVAISEKFVSLHSFGSNSNISDPILDCIRHEIQIERSSSPTRRAGRRAISKPCRNSECGRGLSEILTIPEAFLNKQISSDSFRNYMTSERYKSEYSGDGSCCESIITSAPVSYVTEGSLHNVIQITNGKELETICDMNSENLHQTILSNPESIEQGTDPLDPTTNFSPIISKSIKINSDSQLQQKSTEDKFDLKQNRRVSRSVGSYTDEECSFVLRTSFELGSEPLLNVSHDSQKSSEENKFAVLPKSVEEGQHDFLEKWLESAPDLICSSENLYPDEFLGTSSGRIVSQNSPLMARTDALLKTKSFNLIKPKP